MKDIDPKNPPDASGGFNPGDDGCTPNFPRPPVYPTYPTHPFPDPIPGTDCPAPHVDIK